MCKMLYMVWFQGVSLMIYLESVVWHLRYWQTEWWRKRLQVNKNAVKKSQRFFFFLTFHSEFVSKLNFYILLLINTVVMWFLYMSYDSLFDAVKGRFRFEPIGYLTIFWKHTDSFYLCVLTILLLWIWLNI